MSTKHWTAADSAALYNLPQWSEGYASVGDDGHLLMRPKGPDGPAVDLHAVVRQLELHLPVLIRFTDILRDRVNQLKSAFADAGKTLGYSASYETVYPIKTNQQAAVVQAFVDDDTATPIGLEAGSKPELAAVLGMAPAGGLIVCNGYKDRDYIRRALIGAKLGHRVYIVVEKLSELAIVLEAARDLQIAPRIGLRVRLSSRFASTQQNTGGEKSKFGLSMPQLLEAIRILREADALQTVQMLHVHLGSQVADLRDLRRGLSEAARHYVELRHLGAPLQIMDVGGGLGVDYDGTRSRALCSMNYGILEYARAVLQSLQQVCRESGEPEPDIISESGRALTAHHAVILTSVVDEDGLPDPMPDGKPDSSQPEVVQQLFALLDQTAGQPLERLHDADNLLAAAQMQYGQGQLSLAQRAQAETAYYRVARAIQPLLDPGIRAHRTATEALAERLATKYFLNLSIFQSIPDAWAIDQVFPILPLQRLHERPRLRAKLCDLTCDSDGKLAHYVDREGLMPTVAMHERRPDEHYLVGIFLVGAYQEILGDMHNLFGDTHAANVTLDPAAPDGWRLDGIEPGDTAADLLRYVHLQPGMLGARYRSKLADADLPEAEKSRLLHELDAGLDGYTYLFVDQP